jgi:uncharacterized coiled-coil DUF342 family protein
MLIECIEDLRKENDRCRASYTNMNQENVKLRATNDRNLDEIRKLREALRNAGKGIQRLKAGYRNLLRKFNVVKMEYDFAKPIYAGVYNTPREAVERELDAAQEEYLRGVGGIK